MKRLVICCDGTWQRLYEGGLTNVALTARAIAARDAQNRPQIVYADNVTSTGFDLIAGSALGGGVMVDVAVAVMAGVGTEGMGG